MTVLVLYLVALLPAAIGVGVWLRRRTRPCPHFVLYVNGPGPMRCADCGEPWH